MSKRHQFTVVSLFSGCGGLDLGFKAQGFDLLYACDNDQAAIDVYKRNIDGNAYVRDVTSEEFHSDIEALGQCDVVLGGFPCQGFSKAGPKRSGDARNSLYLEMKKAVAKLQPKVFIAENVDGLSQNFQGKYLEAITSDFEKIGYSVKFKIIDAVSYGAPQHRRRIIFVGQLKDINTCEFEWPQELYKNIPRNGESSLAQYSSDRLHGLNSGVLEPRTIRDAIGDLVNISTPAPDHRVANDWPPEHMMVMRRIKEGQKLCNVRHAPTSVYTWQIPEVFGTVTTDEVLVLETIAKNRRHKQYGLIPNGNPLGIDTICQLTGRSKVDKIVASLMAKNYLKEINGKYDLKGAMFCSGLFKRPLWLEPSPTILTNFHNPRYFIHPIKNRPFSLRECARLQSFPDDFILTATKSIKELIDGYRLIGNAVPPIVSRSLAKSVLELLKSRDKEKYETSGRRQKLGKLVARV